jgi:hypothetical protein
LKYHGNILYVTLNISFLLHEKTSGAGRIYRYMDLIIKAIMLHPHASDGKADMLPVSPN